MSEKFCLKWNDFHSNVSKSFGLFRNEDYLHDVTLVSDDHLQVPAHKLVLSASSEYFKNVLKNSNKPNSHPLLCLDGVNSDYLRNILDYIYYSLPAKIDLLGEKILLIIVLLSSILFNLACSSLTRRLITSGGSLPSIRRIWTFGGDSRG